MSIFFLLYQICYPYFFSPWEVFLKHLDLDIKNIEKIINRQLIDQGQKK